MSILDQLPAVFKDPPPAFAFEVSEAGIAFAPASRPGEVRFHPIEPGVISVTPVRDNVQRPEIFAAHVAALAPDASGRKRYTAALILPDHSARVQVLDFDSFPSSADEQRALIRFRVKKSVPFDVESAAVSYFVQPAKANGKLEVVAAVSALEIVARYEAAFRSAGFIPGLVTTSSLAAMNLVPTSGLTLIAKLSGRILSVLVCQATHLKLVRTVELDDVESDNILSVLHPTVAYVEDELAARPDRLLLCGFGSNTFTWAADWQTELGIQVEGMESKLGLPGPYNAGLLGYLAADGVM